MLSVITKGPILNELCLSFALQQMNDDVSRLQRQEPLAPELQGPVLIALSIQGSTTSMAEFSTK